MSIPDDQSHLDNVRKQLETAVGELSALLGKDGPGANAGGAVPSQLAKHIHFKIFRDYIEHEDELVNARLLWNINIQGFLFATYGFSLQKLAEIQNPPMSPVRPISGIGAFALDWLIIILPVLGTLISTFSLIGIVAAQRAIAQLTCDWGEALKEYLPGTPPPPSGPLLPGIIGGGDGDPTRVKRSWGDLNLRTHKLGFLAPVVFPVIFAGTWIALFVSYRFPYLLNSYLLNSGRH